MDFYIETNSAIKLSNRRNNFFIKDNCFTSILTLCELLTGLDEEVFCLKKKALNFIFDSGVFIDWEMPHKKQHESFGFFNEKYGLTKDSILLFSDIMKKSASFSAFQNAILNYDKEYIILENYDNAFDSYIRKGIDENINAFSSVFSRQQGINECDNIIAMLKAGGESFITVRNAMHIVMAEHLFSSELNRDIKRPLEEIVNFYKGNIDIFVIILGVYSLYKVSRKEAPARNDYIDIFHLVYLVDSTIISDDTIYKKYMTDIFPNNIISTFEFVQKL